MSYWCRRVPLRRIVASTRIATPRRCVASHGVATRHGFVAVLRRVVATTRGVAPRLSLCCFVASIWLARPCAAPLCRCFAPRCLGVRSFAPCSVAGTCRADSFRRCATLLQRFASWHCDESWRWRRVARSGESTQCRGTTPPCHAVRRSGVAQKHWSAQRRRNCAEARRGNEVTWCNTTRRDTT